MSSPFPGMDPFLEQQEWDDFHTRFNLAVSDALTPAIKPNYIARVERRVYVEHPGESGMGQEQRIGDVAIVTSASDESWQGNRVETSGSDSVVSVTRTLEMPQERRETYLVIRERESHEVVTVIETLSPSNKRSGSDGWRAYQAKRDQVLASFTSLVELDLLRGGRRLSVRESLPSGDYYVIVSRADNRPKAEVYAWPLWHRLPEIKIPLLPEDGQVPLDLQSVFEAVYDRAAYDLSLDYTKPLDPPLGDDVTLLMQQQLDQG